MRLPHRLQGQKVKSQGHGAGAYCGGHLAAQLVIIVGASMFFYNFVRWHDSVTLISTLLRTYLLTYLLTYLRRVSNKMEK